MSRSAAPRGGPAGPRRAPAPRSGGRARGPGGARDAGSRQHPSHAFAAGYAARELAADDLAEAQAATARAEAQAAAARAEADAAAARARADAAAARAEAKRAAARGRGDGAADAVPGERATGQPGAPSGLRLLLDQLDELLRDPTLTRALRRFTDRMTASLRRLASSLRLPRLRIPHLSRWLLLIPLLLLLGLGLPALLGWDDDDRSAAPRGAEIALPGVGMPDLQAAPDDPPPARVALVVDDTYTPAALQRELRTLGAWLAANHAPGTRVAVIDAATGRASAPLSADDLARGASTAGRRGTGEAIDAAFAGNGGRRLLVNVGSTAPSSAASTLTVLTRGGAAAPASVPLRRGRRSRVTIDGRRPDALAASVARALIAISGQSERR